MINISIDIIDLMVFALIGPPVMYLARVITEELFESSRESKTAKANKQVTNGRTNKTVRPF